MENGQKRDVLVDVKHFLEDINSYDSKAIHASILFSDLVGSTEFKRYHSIREGLAKTVLHNEVVTKCIIRHGGRVVKYIGDEVMGIFEGEESERLALNAALSIIVEIDGANQQQKWTYFPYSMSTKIGIHSGSVWMFNYGGNQEDPQGTTVDIAARLTSIACPNQIICTKDTYEKACEKYKFPEPKAKHKRYLKGIKELFELSVIVPEGYSSEASISGIQSTPLQKQLNEAYRLIHEKKRNEAFEILNRIYVDNPGDYHVNIHMAEYLLWKGDNGVNTDEQTLETWRMAEKHLEQAVCSRPNSCQSWLLFSWLYFKYYEIGNGDIGQLDKAIECTRRALQCAQDWVNVGSILQAKVNLIHFLSVHARMTGNGEKLNEARNLCVEIHPHIENILNDCRSDFYVAYATVQNMSGSQDYDKIEDMLKKARDLNPRNVRIHKIAEEINKRRYPDNGLSGMLDLSEFSYTR